jgi:hypothetical protein
MNNASRPSSNPSPIASTGKPGIPIGNTTPTEEVNTWIDVMACVTETATVLVSVVAVPLMIVLV